MLASVSEVTVPAAIRMRRIRWRDIRLWVGLALIVISMIVGAKLLSGPEGTATVWRASRDLQVGAEPAVEPVTVHLGDAASSYLPVDVPIDGRMTLPVPAGALIPAQAIGQPVASDVREVTVPVDPLHAPVTLSPGDRVDIWASSTDGAATLPPTLVLADIPVVSADREAVGVGGEIAVVLQIPADDVGELVSAMRGGVIDLSAVPIDSRR